MVLPDMKICNIKEDVNDSFFSSKNSTHLRNSGWATVLALQFPGLWESKKSCIWCVSDIFTSLSSLFLNSYTKKRINRFKAPCEETLSSLWPPFKHLALNGTLDIGEKFIPLGVVKIWLFINPILESFVLSHSMVAT